MILKKNAFTLVEIMIWILIVTIVLISWFESFSKIWVWKINLVEKSNVQKDSFYLTEKIFQLIKEGGTIDYEEYFNRKVIWNTSFTAWHYSIQSGFWNFWRWWILWGIFGNWYYYCRSWNWLVNKLWSNWCYSSVFNTNWISMNWFHQRYWQYSFQFIDYNNNYNNDISKCWATYSLWDEDCDWNIIWDDDDENLWIWPIAFNSWTDVKELYLISWDWTTRTLLRWNVITDPDKIASATCSISWTNVITWDWCRGTIEFLKLKWVDWWMDHIQWNSDNTENDWVIDTWLIDPQFIWWANEVAWSTTNNHWKPLFPTSINVVDFKVYPFPNVESKYFWKSTSISNNISPYVIINFKIKPSWEVRKKIKSNPQVINFNMTVNLTDIFSK